MARPKDATGVPLGVKRSAGSRVRLPSKMTLLKLAIRLLSGCAHDHHARVSSTSSSARVTDVSARPKVFWYNITLDNSKTMRDMQPISRAMKRAICASPDRATACTLRKDDET